MADIDGSAPPGIIGWWSKNHVQGTVDHNNITFRPGAKAGLVVPTLLSMRLEDRAYREKKMKMMIAWDECPCHSFPCLVVTGLG